MLQVEVESERLVLPLQIVDWSHPLLPRFGSPARIATAADRIAHALGISTASSSSS